MAAAAATALDAGAEGEGAGDAAAVVVAAAAAAAAGAAAAAAAGAAAVASVFLGPVSLGSARLRLNGPAVGRGLPAAPKVLWVLKGTAISGRQREGLSGMFS